jgi:hypothetical protein
MIPSERTSARASASVASAEIIGVRNVVRAAPSSSATGSPTRMSNSTYTPLDDRLAPGRVGGLDADQLDPGSVACGRRHDEELASTGLRLHPVDM